MFIYLIMHNAEGFCAMGDKEYVPGKEINRKAFAILGKLLKDMHASAHSIFPDHASPSTKLKIAVNKLLVF